MSRNLPVEGVPYYRFRSVGDDLELLTATATYSYGVVHVDCSEDLNRVMRLSLFNINWKRDKAAALKARAAYADAQDPELVHAFARWDAILNHSADCPSPDDALEIPE